ncbi:MAG TPA: U32 family peptidase [Flavisolibacter sp.]
MRHHVKLLAPAGSYESLHAAIQAGADAIYFGVEQLNMRARSAPSFTTTDIGRVAAICRNAGIRAYITLNTVMFDHDMQLARSIIREVKKHGIDAVIASDVAVMQLCRQQQVPVHISTQANVSNYAAVEFYAPMADVVVLARELSLSQVAHINRQIRRKQLKGVSGNLVETEIFIHGALCMAVSGKCYLSLHAHNASANRGACQQNCRRPYQVTDMETGHQLAIDNEYIMSPQDLCTIDILDQVVASGASVLKIEGRTKGPEYVFTVTKAYHEALRALQDGSFTAEKAMQWKAELAKVYNRGFWEGYYLGRELGVWTAHPGSAATEKKIHVGRGSHFYPKAGIAEFLVESGKLETGDTVLITSPRFGMVRETVDRLVVNGAESSVAVKGDRITIPMSQKITTADRLYKIIPANG